jgi:hypothetical protein
MKSMGDMEKMKYKMWKIGTVVGERTIPFGAGVSSSIIETMSADPSGDNSNRSYYSIRWF